MQLAIVFSIVGIAFGLAYPEDDFCLLDSIRQEAPCSRQGGMCTIDCPRDKLTKQRGLCPMQRSWGVDCCYGFSTRETRCRKRGGECFRGKNPCNPCLVYPDATDCPRGTTCCILVTKK